VVGDDLAGVFLGGLVITEQGVAVSGVEDPFGVVEHEVILGNWTRKLITCLQTEWPRPEEGPRLRSSSASPVARE
jgi:hypothetical protein